MIFTWMLLQILFNKKKDIRKLYNGYNNSNAIQAYVPIIMY